MLFLFDKPLAQLASVAWPAYNTYKSLQSDSVDRKQLLLSWVMLAFLSIFEHCTEWLLSWVPFYWTAKLLLLVWLQLPQTNGASVLYNSYIEPLLAKFDGDIDKCIATYLLNAHKFVQQKVSFLWSKHGNQIVNQVQGRIKVETLQGAIKNATAAKSK